MDLRFTPEELAFREEVRTFIRKNLPADTRDRMKLGHPPRKEDTVRWQRILNAKGWAALSWPKEWGGPGSSVVLGAIGGASTCGAAFVLFLGSMRDTAIANWLYLLFGLALGCTACALVAFLADSMLAWHGLRREGSLPHPR